MAPFLGRTCTTLFCGCLWVASLPCALGAEGQAPPTKPAAPQSDPVKKPSGEAEPTTPPTTKEPADEATKRRAADQPTAPLGPLHASLFKDLDGKPVSLADSAGKPIVIEMWATWCGPCRKQRASLHRLAKEFPDVVFVAASTDEKGPDVVKAFLAKNPDEKGEESRIRDLMSTPQFRAVVAKVRKENSIPQTVFVSRKGEIADVALGQQDERFMRAVLKNLLKAKAPGSEPKEADKAPTKDGRPGVDTKEKKDVETGTPSGAPASR